jgi:hypothetical protein
VTATNLGGKLIEWAMQEHTVHLLVLIGSRSRPPDDPTRADANSDWDFQLATSDTEMFGNGRWLERIGLRPIAYVARQGRLGSVLKVTTILAEGELDLVIIPVAQLAGIARQVRTGEHTVLPATMRALGDVAAVIAGGHQLLKGAEQFLDLYRFIAREVPPPSLVDEEVRRLAEGFVCDYVSTLRKVERGELLAAQRWLHHSLIETNFRLLHEARQRQGKVTFPDARRLESLAPESSQLVKASAVPTAESLRSTAEAAAATFRDLVRQLLGDRWQWPDLSHLRLRTK